MTPRIVLRGAFAALAFLLFVGQSHGQELRTDLETLTATSEAVVVAQAVEKESFWNEDRTAILTRVVLQVEDQLMGQAASMTEIIIPGGQIGDVMHEVSDMPHFEVDEQAIVFVERHRSGVLIVSGGLHGKLPVHRDSNTGIRTVSGATEFFEVSSVNNSEEVEDDRIPLDDFKLRFKELRDRR